ncbi:hypothetical protein A3H65_02655 [Candidatus Giovannonibacteria bacterium RIFCSPLOWO2_02_FULL_45_14]|uniref:Uncharacterized protein n=3 Tax=Parcubacteria group TaxID=1794811 RepID=A0A0H4TCD3_9BACT|nr:hypothetical protein [uncultured Parcubacteria bacterium Rifle_16ft_4_minimus_37658]AKQ05688.1 hypothetical protein [uncultured Parcubacteria bacterium Rifle_16ft_4_minimus_23641]OGF69919.1 MAG: hypothetical protein A3C75_01070 [Candidatus Giovannonibacteria bacterium RIFCSPHIGHO2_02_FULL_44_31]OGF76958.1 MAG: hypothetical protein A3E62_01310 [Candidatus Giovannonibacteria bacterium RIFCSPHIGHO2_12_FULL_44_29]OGF90459.1 MAG: hypothetical protein A3H65_02655 [Candidatus Giovannonibacteria bac
MLNFTVSGKLILIIFLAIFLVHGWATLSAAYFYYWWLDLVLHGAGGLWVGMTALYLIRNENFSPIIIFWLVFGSAAIVGLFWEFFEFALAHLPGELSKFGFIQQGIEDVLSDLLSDLIGGIIAFSLFRTQQKNYNNKQ